MIPPVWLNRTRAAKSANAVFGPEESAMTTSRGASWEGVASNFAVNVPVWFAKGILTHVVVLGEVLMHSGITMKLQTVAEAEFGAIAGAVAVDLRQRIPSGVCSVAGIAGVGFLVGVVGGDDELAPQLTGSPVAGIGVV